MLSIEKNDLIFANPIPFVNKKRNIPNSIIMIKGKLLTIVFVE